MNGRLVASVLIGLGLLGGSVARAANLECLVYPHTVVSVAPAVEGLLDKVLVDRGDIVREGQVVATMESTVERGSVRMARARAERESSLKSGQARVQFGDRRYIRTRDMFQKSLIPEKEMDEAETSKVLAEFELLQAQEDYRLAGIDLERATAALELRTIRSPIDGVVVERLLNGGEFTKQAPVLRLARLDPLRVEVLVPLAMYGKIRVGMPADVMPENPVGGHRRAEVTVVDRLVDPASGTFGVRLALPNPDYRLPAGLKCRVQFNLNGR